MGMGMSQQVLSNSVAPSKKREFKGDLINPNNKKKRKTNPGAKFI
jgi:hypothetical protein